MRFLYIITIMVMVVQLSKSEVYGQQLVHLKLKLINKDDSLAVPLAKISLLDKDGKIWMEASSDLEGNCTFNLPDSLNNKLRIHSAPLGFKDFVSPVISYDSIGQQKIISLEKSVILLKEVSIFEKQVTKSGDKLIYRVKQDQFSAATATIELFNKLPGISLTKAGVKRNGKTGVLILINGIGELKDQSAQLATLASLSSDQIDKIEISSFPSARYDASVSTVINIITKKERNMSNFNASIGQPFFKDEHKFGADNIYGGSSANLNFKINKIRVSFLFNIRNNRYPENLETQTTTYGIERFSSTTNSNYSSLNLDPSLNIDYDINEKSSLSINADVSIQPFSNTDQVEHDNFYNAITNKLDSTTIIDNRHRSNQKQFELTGNYKYLIDKKENSALYINFIYHGSPFNYTDVFNGVSSISGNNTLITRFNSQSNIVNGSAIFSDLIKSSFVSTEFGIKSNTLSYNTLQELDADESIFHYHEQISSLFFTPKWKFGKYSLSTGFRTELLNSKSDFLREVEGENQITRAKLDYFKIYPNLLLEDNVNDDLTLSLGYTKRLRRPRSIFLNPSVTRSYYTSTSGNLYNQPTYFDRLEGQALYKDWAITLFYEHSSNLLFSAPTNVALYSYQYLNAARANNWGISASKEFKISKWFSSTLNTDLSRTSQSANDISFYKNEWTNFDISASGDFTFTKKNRLQVDISYYAKSYSGYATYLGQLYSSVIFRQVLLRDVWSLNIAVNDPLGLEKNRSNAFYPGQLVSGRDLTNSRTLSIELVYQFPLGQKFMNQVYKKKNDGEIRN